MSSSSFSGRLKNPDRGGRKGDGEGKRERATLYGTMLGSCVY